MERLINLKLKFGTFWLSFIGERMYIALNLSYNLFEPDLTRPLTNIEQVTRFLAELERITGIVEDLDLNTRVWTKLGGEDRDKAASHVDAELLRFPDTDRHQGLEQHSTTVRP